MDDQLTDARPPSVFKRVGRAFLNLSVVLALVLVACLIGVGGASLFIYKQMGNHVSLSKTSPAKGRAVESDADGGTRPKVIAVGSGEGSEHHSATPTVAESTEWHFAEFSDKPRYIDVTYDGGRQHARLKVNTVLSSKAESAPGALVSDDTTDDDAPASPQSSQPVLSAGSHYIVDKDTGRVVGIDGTAGEAMEVRRAQPVTSNIPLTNTIRNPVPEVRVASPVLQLGRPIFDSDRPVQAAIPVPKYLPSRKAIPVSPDELADTGAPVVSNNGAYGTDNQFPRRTRPASRDTSASQYDQIFDQPARTSVFRRDRPGN